MNRKSFIASLFGLLAYPFLPKQPKRTLTMSDGVRLTEGDLLLPAYGNHPYKLIWERQKWRMISLCERRTEQADFWEEPETMYKFVNLIPARDWVKDPKNKGHLNYGEIVKDCA